MQGTRGKSQRYLSCKRARSPLLLATSGILLQPTKSWLHCIVGLRTVQANTKPHLAEPYRVFVKG
jgi:hypothetical protein